MLLIIYLVLLFQSWVIWPWVFWDIGYFGLGYSGLGCFGLGYFGFGYFGVKPFRTTFCDLVRNKEFRATLKISFIFKTSKAAWKYNRRDHAEHHSSGESIQIKKIFKIFRSPVSFGWLCFNWLAFKVFCVSKPKMTRLAKCLQVSFIQNVNRTNKYTFS